ncbi:MAG: HlyD family efflux transporter periplasmic adaptor subunit [Rhodospirillaceae bacterium]|nr:HlyD family efflux transporter periplasmic adaptor subunit [Rhodospirillaceae bacterium]
MARAETGQAERKSESLWRRLIRRLRGSDLPDGIARANGRLDAEQVDVATKYAGRIAAVLVEEGQTVEAGAVIARMDAAELEAQLQGAEAQVRRAERAKDEAEAAIAQRVSERTLAKQELDRAIRLHEKGFFPTEKLDQRRSQMESAAAAYRAAIASLEQAIAAIAAARADVARLKSQLADTVLKAPRRGRVQYKLAQAGEVLAAGARVATLLDLTDVYMTIYLPARDAGRLALGAEARIVLDPAPQYVIPAKVSFVATEAQFTPKSVETADEREKLMFRVKLRLAPELLRRYESQAKTGVRGVGYVRTRSDVAWPDTLRIKLPQ